jgi:hypothetical protein
MRMQNVVFVKYINVPTDCTCNRNTSYRGTGIKIKINIKWRKISDGPRGNTQSN